MPDHSSRRAQADLKTMANAIRALAMDAVEKAGSGHPGMPMGMADVATVLFTEALKFDSAAPDWPDRDRFVLSAGHGSMLLYALLWLTGYPGWTVEDLQAFRQWDAKTAGHPEYGAAPGIETTTGPLGQGFANSVGMAIAEAHLRAEFGAGLVDHFTYVLASDGDLMEGLSHEAAALAGHLRLNKLITLYDDNLISIDGATSLSDSTNALKRFEAYGWRAERIDGHDPAAIASALERARASDCPSLIACRTIIGFGAPKKQGTAAAHGAALGKDEIAAARARLGWPHAPFEIPADLLAQWRGAGERGRAARNAWEQRLEAAPSERRAELLRRLKGDLKPGLSAALAVQRKALVEKASAVSTRKASELALEVINAELPETIGGSADLTGSNNTKTKGLKLLTAADPAGRGAPSQLAGGSAAGRYLHYGVREHGMAGAMNGMALHGGVIPYGGTFLVFADYCRPSIRLAALMGQRVIFVMTHDSIGLGEDGPTHQPIEHLAALRAIPNLLVMRPADAIETSECWEIALVRRDGPSLLALSRQDLAQVRLTASATNLSARGAYVLKAASPTPRAVLIATGSEVQIAIEAQGLLDKEGIAVSIVSMPAMSLFDAQGAEYRASVLPEGLPSVAIEAGVRQGWEKYIETAGGFVGLHGFGASAPYKTLYEKFGVTPDAVVKAVRERV
jgi:transketolase